jgi:hypothetical protein
MSTASEAEGGVTRRSVERSPRGAATARSDAQLAPDGRTPTALTSARASARTAETGSNRPEDASTEAPRGAEARTLDTVEAGADTKGAAERADGAELSRPRRAARKVAAALGRAAWAATSSTTSSRGEARRAAARETARGASAWDGRPQPETTLGAASSTGAATGAGLSSEPSAARGSRRGRAALGSETRAAARGARPKAALSTDSDPS